MREFTSGPEYTSQYHTHFDNSSAEYLDFSADDIPLAFQHHNHQGSSPLSHSQTRAFFGPSTCGKASAMNQSSGPAHKGTCATADALADADADISSDGGNSSDSTVIMDSDVSSSFSDDGRDMKATLADPNTPASDQELVSTLTQSISQPGPLARHFSPSSTSPTSTSSSSTPSLHGFSQPSSVQPALIASNVALLSDNNNSGMSSPPSVADSDTEGDDNPNALDAFALFSRLQEELQNPTTRVMFSNIVPGPPTPPKPRSFSPEDTTALASLSIEEAPPQEHVTLQQSRNNLSSHNTLHQVRHLSSSPSSTSPSSSPPISPVSPTSGSPPRIASSSSPFPSSNNANTNTNTSAHKKSAPRNASTPANVTQYRSPLGTTSTTYTHPSSTFLPYMPSKSPQSSVPAAPFSHAKRSPAHAAKAHTVLSSVPPRRHNSENAEAFPSSGYYRYSSASKLKGSTSHQGKRGALQQPTSILKKHSAYAPAKASPESSESAISTSSTPPPSPDTGSVMSFNDSESDCSNDSLDLDREHTQQRLRGAVATGSSHTSKDQLPHAASDAHTASARRVSWSDHHGRRLVRSISFKSVDSPFYINHDASTQFTAFRTSRNASPVCVDEAFAFDNKSIQHDAAATKGLVQENNIQLEAVNLQLPDIFFSVLVNDLCFSKRVYVRYTTDGWKSYTDVDGSFRSSMKGMARFGITLRLDNYALVQKIEFCFCFEARDVGQVFWDNNRSKNYQIAKPCASSHA